MLDQYNTEVQELTRIGYKLIPIDSLYYPKALRDNMRDNAPSMIFSYGDSGIYEQDAIAIVGKRRVSPKGLDFTESVAKEAVADGKVVVSGYAEGTDKAALYSAIENGGKSIVVLPQGITTFNPDAIKEAIQLGRVVVMSTFNPYATWHAGLAMARNKTIYNLAQSVYISESDFKGGTWGGANEGLKDINKRIYIMKPNGNDKIANQVLIDRGAIGVSGYYY